MKFNSISLYDKSDNLIGYVEYQDDVDIKCYYNASGTRLMRKFTNQYTDDNEICLTINGTDATTVDSAEVVSSILEYDNAITLYPIQVYGETTMRILTSGTTNLTTANVVSRVDSYTELTNNITDTSLTSSSYCINNITDTSLTSSYTTNFSSTSIECHTVSQDFIDNLKNKL